MTQVRLHLYIAEASVHRKPVGLRLRRYSKQAATPEWWKKLTKKAQDFYKKLHPGTKLKLTFRMPRPSTPEYDPIPPGEDPFQRQQDITHDHRRDIEEQGSSADAGGNHLGAGAGSGYPWRRSDWLGASSGTPRPL
jgi:hypothetical protein